MIGSSTSPALRLPPAANAWADQEKDTRAARRTFGVRKTAEEAHRKELEAVRHGVNRKRSPSAPVLDAAGACAAKPWESNRQWESLLPAGERLDTGLIEADAKRSERLHCWGLGHRAAHRRSGRIHIVDHDAGEIAKPPRRFAPAGSPCEC